MKKKEHLARPNLARACGAWEPALLLSKALPPSVRDVYGKDALSGILGAVMAGCTGPFIMVIARDKLHASAAMMGFMTAAPFIGNLFAVFWANAMEGKNKVPFVVWSSFAARAVFFAAVFATTPTAFAAIVIASNIMSTIASPAYAAVMREIYPKRIRGRAMAYSRVCTASTGILTVFLAGPLLHHVSYRTVFPIGALVGIFSSLTFRTIETAEVEPTEKTKTSEFFVNTLRILKEDVPFRWFALSVFMAGFGTLTVLPLYPIFQVDNLRITTTQVAIIANTGAVVTVLGFFFWGPFIDKRTPLKAAAMSIFMVAVTPLTYAIAAAYPGILPQHMRWMILLPASAIQGVANAGIELSYFNSILRFSPAERVSHYQALFMSLLGVRGAIAPIIGAFLIEHNIVQMQYLFVGAAATCVISAILQIYGARTHTVR